MVFVTAKKEGINMSSNNVLSPKADFLHSPVNSTLKLHRSTSGLNTSYNTLVGDDESQPIPLSLSFLNKKRYSDTNDPNDYESLNNMPGLSLILPKLVRKKSGELVKSSLKVNSLMDGVSKSMPNTPTFKNVHFGHDVDVCYFNEREKPSAVSASNSPALKPTRLQIWSKSKIRKGASFQLDQFGGLQIDENFNTDYNNINDIHDDNDDDIHDEFDDEDLEVTWNLKNLNFTKIKYNEKFQQKSKIFLERLSLDDENKDDDDDDDDNSLIGLIAVKNLSFEKKIHVRYTFDNWKTVIEIKASFDNEGSTKILKRANYDRFKFKIPLSNFKFLNQENIKILFCIRYRYEQHEVWDNNDHKNYELLLTRSRKPKFFERSKFMYNEYFNQNHHSYSFEPYLHQYHQENVPMTNPVGITNYDTTESINGSYFNNYDILKSSNTQNVLKNSIDPNNDGIEEVSPITPVFRNSNKSVNISTPPSISHANKDTTTVSYLVKSENKPSLLSMEENYIKDATTEPKNKNITTHKTNYVPLQREKPSINSKCYQELLDSCCFFKGSDNNAPLTISSYLNDN